MTQINVWWPGGCEQQLCLHTWPQASKFEPLVLSRQHDSSLMQVPTDAGLKLKPVHVGMN